MTIYEQTLPGLQPEARTDTPVCRRCGRPAHWSRKHKWYLAYCGSQGCAAPSEPQAPRTEAPRCAMCARPAHWSKARQGWGRYCTAANCNNPERICAIPACQKSFTINIDGAGTKYCSTECKTTGYHPERGRSQVKCAWCAAVGYGHNRQNAIWPYICADCQKPIRHLVDRLKDHHVPHERARALIANPYCEVSGCGNNIVDPAPQRGTDKLAALLVVDHDHDCCPGSSSCGKCIRGLICRYCNIAAGGVRNNPSIALGIADYLRGRRA